MYSTSFGWMVFGWVVILAFLIIQEDLKEIVKYGIITIVVSLIFIIAILVNTFPG